VSVRLVAAPYGTPSPLSPLIGRREEIAAALALLADPDVRLLTMIGPGGIGKTRLALRVAADISDDFADGVLFVSLAAIRDPAFVIPAIAHAAGLPESTDEAGLVAHFANLELLLLLDNFEQIVTAAPVVARLLEQCPALKVITTSRMPLHLQGEQRFPVAPLSLPAKGAATLESLRGSDAVDLFVQRVRAIRPNLNLTERDAPVAAEICQRLDGLPLALELAAARTNVLSLPALLARLTDRLHLLVGDHPDRPERLRTMRLAIDWSYDLLPPLEQAIFRRAAVFAGGSSLDALETVVGRTGITTHAFLDSVSRLVDHSLMHREDTPNGESRIAMLATLCEYGVEQMCALDEETAARDAHAAYFLELAEGGEAKLTGPGQTDWLEQLEIEQDNLRAALAWALQRGDPETALRISASIWRFWSTRGRMTEGRDWVERALSASETIADPIRLRGFIAAAFLASDAKDFNAAVGWFRRSIALAESLGERMQLAKALDGLGTTTHALGDFAAAAEYHERAAHIGEELGDQRMLAITTANLGTLDYHLGDLEAAGRRWETCRRIVHELGDAQGEALMSSNLAALAVMQSDYERAEALLRETIAVVRDFGNQLLLSDNLVNLGDIHQVTGDLNGAMARYNEATAILQEADDAYRLAVLNVRIAKIVFAQGDPARSLELFSGSVRELTRIGDQFGLAESVEELALIMVQDPDARIAARLYGAVAALRARIGAPRREPEIPAYEAAAAKLRAALGDVGFREAMASGELMTADELVSFVGSIPRPSAKIRPPAIAPVEPERARLSSRELDVLRLVAAGYSSREIADALFISPRTATTHVEHILAKLGVNSRSAAVAVAMREGLV
jgi:predicted ATPase/DNA-binding CsgD family transcriptional regulator